MHEIGTIKLRAYVCLIAMRVRTTIAETVLCTASQNVNSHPVLCAVEDCSISSTEAACLDSHELLDFDEYRSVAL